VSGIVELQQLIEALEQHRSTFGNAQYAFPASSKQREVLHDFSKGIGQLLRASYQRIEELFYDTVYWHDTVDEVKEHLSILIWSRVRIVYLREDHDDAETIRKKIRAKQTEFLATFEARIAKHPSHSTKTVDPALIEQVQAWTVEGFTMWC
jgi:hypothetical protein